MCPGGEVPKPKAPAGAKGAFSATVTESGSTRTISWKLTFTRPERKGGRRPYPQGQGRCRGRRDRPALRPVPERSDGEGEDLEGYRRRARAGVAYVNVHTAKNAAGEIRGQVKLLEQRPPRPTTRRARPGHDDDDHAAAGYGGGGDPSYLGRSPGPVPTRRCAHTKGVSRRETPFASKL